MKRFIVEIHNSVELSDKVLRALLINAIPGGPRVTAMLTALAPDEFVEAARERHCYRSDDEIEIDDPADMSEGEDGVWIRAWVFVPGIGSQYVNSDAETEEESP